MPIQPIIRNAVEFVRNNPKMIKDVAVGMGAVGGVMYGGSKKIIDEFRDSKKRKLEKGGYPYRKERKIIFQTEILKQLPVMKKKELFFHLLEVEDIIQAINSEKGNTNKKNPKNLLRNKELKAWNIIHQIISSAMNNLDYEELLLHYHDQDYKSDYFEGFKLIVETLDKHVSNGDKEKVHFYIKEITDKPMTKIRKDFI